MESRIDGDWGARGDRVFASEDHAMPSAAVALGDIHINVGIIRGGGDGPPVLARGEGLMCGIGRGAHNFD